MVTEILKSFLITSFIGTGLTILLTLIKPITKKLFGYRWHYYIWLAVLVVMVLPVRFTFTSTDIAAPLTKSTVLPQSITASETLLTDTAPIVTHSPAIATEAPQHHKSNPLADLWQNLGEAFAVLWLLGIFAMLSFSIIGYARLLHRIHKKSVVISCPEIRKYTKRSITVRICKDLSSPFIMGILRPTLILPHIELTPEQLDNILMHEVTHLKRNDILYKWFVAFVKALHWFNPAVYYISKQVNTECEISCDMAVVRDMDNTQTTDYVNTILSLLSTSKAKNLPLTTGMTGNKNTLKKRFAMIKNKFIVNKKAMIISIISAILIFLFAICISGFLSGRWASSYDNTVIELSTDTRTGNTFNTLIIGVDEQNRADSLMVLMLSDTSIDGFSIPRNALFDGKTATQILTEENGDQKVIDAVRGELLVPITYYAKVKIDLIEDLVDTVGGLTVDVPMDMKYDDPYKNLHIDLKKGEEQHLDGKQVCGLLQFKRSNDGTGYAEGDMERIRVAQQVASAFFTQNKLQKLILNSKDIIDSINENVVTNYKIKDFIKDKKLLSGKNIAFYIVPGKTSMNNGVLNYTLNSAPLSLLTTRPTEANTPLEKTENPDSNPPESVSFNNTTLAPVSKEANENTTIYDMPMGDNPPEIDETTNHTDFDLSDRLDFSNIAEAEQYLQARGKKVAEDKNFKSGSNYMIDDYSFKTGPDEKVSNVICNDKGEVSVYFNGNRNTLMRVSFTDSETKDEVNSAVILTGHERIYKFTGLDPDKHYDIEITDMTEGEWEIEGKYIIF